MLSTTRERRPREDRVDGDSIPGAQARDSRTPAAVYQSVTRLSGGRYILSPGFTSKAA